MKQYGALRLKSTAAEHLADGGVLSLIPALGVVALFEDTIEQVVLAVLMPLAAAITGNAGHQALAVTLRGITLNEMRWVRIGGLLRWELVVGLSSGLSWRAGGGAVGGSWLGGPGVLMGQDNWKLGSILGLSMTVSLGVGTIAGVSIPLLMRRLGFDLLIFRHLFDHDYRRHWPVELLGICRPWSEVVAGGGRECTRSGPY